MRLAGRWARHAPSPGARLAGSGLTAFSQATPGAGPLATNRPDRRIEEESSSRIRVDARQCRGGGHDSFGSFPDPASGIELGDFLLRGAPAESTHCDRSVAQGRQAEGALQLAFVDRRGHKRAQAQVGGA